MKKIQLAVFYKPYFFVMMLFISHKIVAQEIAARAYSNAPIGTSFISGGVAQARSGSYELNTQIVSYTHIVDVAGQSAGMSLVLPYAQLDGSSRQKGQTINASANGLSDPVIRASFNLHGAPALSQSQFRDYQQDLIIGASITAVVPWGQYSSEQLVNVGANRWVIQPAIGASQALGQWRLELAGMPTFFTKNSSYMGSSSLEQRPIYSGSSHVIYYFSNNSNSAWISGDATYFVGGQTYVNNRQIMGPQENWRLGTTISYPINMQNSVRLNFVKGVYARTDTSYNAIGLSWQYMWNAN